MSNHIHFIIRDNAGQLAKLMEYFVGNLARDLNRLDGERGQVFERRYTPIEIVDEGAVLDRLAYTMANPARANLVETHRQWPGLCGVGRALDGAVFTRPVLSRTDTATPGQAEQATLRATDLTDPAAAAAAVEAAEREARDARGARGVLGAKAALEVHPRSRPKTSKRSRRPLCHASSPELWQAFRDGWERFVERYRVASAAFLRGSLGVPFPAHSFRPHSPVSPSASPG